MSETPRPTTNRTPRNARTAAIVRWPKRRLSELFSWIAAPNRFLPSRVLSSRVPLSWFPLHLAPSGREPYQPDSAPSPTWLMPLNFGPCAAAVHSCRSNWERPRRANVCSNCGTFSLPFAIQRGDPCLIPPPDGHSCQSGRGHAVRSSAPLMTEALTNHFALD